MKPNIESSWKELLKEEFEADYFASLKEFLIQEKSKYRVYPPGSLIFNAFDKTPVDKVKVVILGQDPYHGKGQAHGLCFSVQAGVKPPPSLVNIFKELNSDLNIPVPNHGNLEKWAEQGVLLLNATLTVRAAQAGSHQNKGWETFTNAAIQKLATHKKGLIFILWGRFAQAKAELINSTDHYILKAAHPSPFSAYNGFFGCKHFSKTNEILIAQNKTPIDWSL
ncbi:MAG: uracil-DNA glycosylase [Chlorobi bacterium]|nr:uracil-DNA glycosylase [Chlorobiota bacterium]